jgi:hypothetical protein
MNWGINLVHTKVQGHLHKHLGGQPLLQIMVFEEVQID